MDLNTDQPYTTGQRVYAITGFRFGEPGIVVKPVVAAYGMEGYVMTFMDGTQDLYYHDEVSAKRPLYPAGNP